MTTAPGSTRQSDVDVQLYGATPSPFVSPPFLDVSLVADSVLSKHVTQRGGKLVSSHSVRPIPAGA